MKQQDVRVSVWEWELLNIWTSGSQTERPHSGLRLADEPIKEVTSWLSRADAESVSDDAIVHRKQMRQLSVKTMTWRCLLLGYVPYQCSGSKTPRQNVEPRNRRGSDTSGHRWSFLWWTTAAEGSYTCVLRTHTHQRTDTRIYSHSLQQHMQINPLLKIVPTSSFVKNSCLCFYLKLCVSGRIFKFKFSGLSRY